MTKLRSQIHSPDVLNHDLNQYFPYLLKFESIEKAKQSYVYLRVEPTVDRILSAVVCESLSPLIQASSRTVFLNRHRETLILFYRRS
jgi:hypothetical protein